MNHQNSSPFQAGQVTSSPWAVAMATESERTAFIRRTYLHLAGAIAAFIGLELLLFNVFPDTVDRLVLVSPALPHSCALRLLPPSVPAVQGMLTMGLPSISGTVLAAATGRDARPAARANNTRLISLLN